jgi:hypothetical protein
VHEPGYVMTVAGVDVYVRSELERVGFMLEWSEP